MSDLILAVDAAWPPDLRLLPFMARVIIGYLGEQGATPHVWTRAEADIYRANGRRWWGVWVPPQHDMSGAAAVRAAQDAMMQAQLMGCAKTDPLFVDIEAGTWQANPAQAAYFVSVFKKYAAGHGWAHPFGYVPLAAGFDWVAHWTGQRPTALPPGWVGQQYASDVAAGAYDLSVFDPALVGVTTGATTVGGSRGRQAAMRVARDKVTGTEYLQLDGSGQLFWIPDSDDAEAEQSQLGPAAELSPAYLQQFPGYRKPAQT